MKIGIQTLRCNWLIPMESHLMFAEGLHQAFPSLHQHGWYIKCSHKVAIEEIFYALEWKMVTLALTQQGWVLIAWLFLYPFFLPLILFICRLCGIWTRYGSSAFITKNWGLIFRLWCKQDECYQILFCHITFIFCFYGVIVNSQTMLVLNALIKQYIPRCIHLNAWMFCIF